MVTPGTWQTDEHTTEAQRLLVSLHDRVCRAADLVRQELRGEDLIDSLDRVPLQGGCFSTAAILEHMLRDLRDVELALHRVGHDRYGLCEVCGQHIPAERLAIRPTARICPRCEVRGSPACLG